MFDRVLNTRLIFKQSVHKVQSINLLRGHSFGCVRKILPKTDISYPLIRTVKKCDHVNFITKELLHFKAKLPALSSENIRGQNIWEPGSFYIDQKHINLEQVE